MSVFVCLGLDCGLGIWCCQMSLRVVVCVFVCLCVCVYVYVCLFVCVPVSINLTVNPTLICPLTLNTTTAFQPQSIEELQDAVQSCSIDPTV